MCQWNTGPADSLSHSCSSSLSVHHNEGFVLIVRKEDKVKRKTLLKRVLVLPHANVLEEKLKPTGQTTFGTPVLV